MANDVDVASPLIPNAPEHTTLRAQVEDLKSQVKSLNAQAERMRKHIGGMQKEATAALMKHRAAEELIDRLWLLVITPGSIIPDVRVALMAYHLKNLKPEMFKVAGVDLASGPDETGVMSLDSSTGRATVLPLCSFCNQRHVEPEYPGERCRWCQRTVTLRERHHPGDPCCPCIIERLDKNG